MAGFQVYATTTSSVSQGLGTELRSSSLRGTSSQSIAPAPGLYIHLDSGLELYARGEIKSMGVNACFLVIHETV